MKILLIDRFFAENGRSRGFALAKEWSKTQEIFVITCDFCPNTKENPQRQEEKKQWTREGIEVLSLKTPPHTHQLLRWPENQRLWTESLALQLEGVCENFQPDRLILSSSVPAQIRLVVKAAKNRQIPLVVEILHPETLIQWEEDRPALGKWLGDTVEKLLSPVDLVVVNRREAAGFLIEKGVIAEKIHVILDPLRTLPENHDFPEELQALRKRSDLLLVCHGRFRTDRLLEELLEAVRPLENVGVVLMGRGAYKVALKRLSSQMPNVLFPEENDRGQRAAYFFAADALFYGKNPSFSSCGQNPARLLTLLSMGKPVLLAADWTDSPVEQVGGVVAEPTAEGIRQGICTLEKMTDAERKIIGEKGVELACRYLPEMVAKEYFHHLEQS